VIDKLIERQISFQILSMVTIHNLGAYLAEVNIVWLWLN